MMSQRRRLIAASALSISLVASSAAGVDERAGSRSGPSGGLIPEEAEVILGDHVDAFVDPAVQDEPPSSPGPLRRRLPNAAGAADDPVQTVEGHHDMTNIFNGKSARHQAYCAKLLSDDRGPEPLAPRRASLANASPSVLAQYGGLRSANGGGSSSSEYGQPGGPSTCTGGFAAGYPCNNVDLQSFVTLFELNASIRPNDKKPQGNDVWGWADEGPGRSGREFALVGLRQGVAIVEVTTPQNPVYFGGIEGANNGAGTMWRDIKVYKDHAFLVSEASGHGMQVFDMTRLLSLAPNQLPRQFTPDRWYTAFNNAHNIYINEQSGYAYAVGTNKCSGGLLMINIQSPKNPSNYACFSEDGYTHDVECVNYKGPDTYYRGREICFACNEDTVTIVDVTNKNNPVMLSRTSYTGDQYTHQGSLTEDHSTFIFGDEGDEERAGVQTQTYIMDVTDLNNPSVISDPNTKTTYANPNTKAIDHNQYVRGQYSYQANYDAGLRVMDVSGARSGSIKEVGYFDIVPRKDSAEFYGAWSVYPYFPSGTVVVSGTNQGLYVLQPKVLKGAGTGGGQEKGSVLYRESFDLDGEGMSKARRVTRIPTPSGLTGKGNNADDIGRYVGRALFPEGGRKRMFGAVLEREDWVNVPAGADKVKVEAMFALARPKRGRLLIQVVLQYDTGRWAGGSALPLGDMAHERWAEYSSDVKVVRRAEKVKRVAVRVRNEGNTGAPKQVMYVGTVKIKIA